MNYPDFTVSKPLPRQPPTPRVHCNIGIIEIKTESNPEVQGVEKDYLSVDYAMLQATEYAKCLSTTFSVLEQNSRCIPTCGVWQILHENYRGRARKRTRLCSRWLAVCIWRLCTRWGSSTFLVQTMWVNSILQFCTSTTDSSHSLTALKDRSDRSLEKNHELGELISMLYELTSYATGTCVRFNGSVCARSQRASYTFPL